MDIYQLMSQRKVPITRLNKFFAEEDFDLDISMGQEWLHGDMNFTFVLYRVDRQRTKKDDVYGEVVSEGIQIESPTNQFMGNSRIGQVEPGNLKVGIYQSYLDEMGVDVEFGDYIGYYEKEDRVRYYSVADDGRITSDNRHTYGGYKPYYRSIIASPVSNDEFNGI
jgi:hypothetical protein